jgi:hypothetical protein
MDSFVERYWPVDGQKFLSRSGTWLCDVTAPVDVSGVDRRTFHLRFNQIKPDRRWTGPTVRTLELRTSLHSFTFDPSYGSWLRVVVNGFLDSDKVDYAQEAYEVERTPQGAG